MSAGELSSYALTNCVSPSLLRRLLGPFAVLVGCLRPVRQRWEALPSEALPWEQPPWEPSIGSRRGPRLEGTLVVLYTFIKAYPKTGSSFVRQPLPLSPAMPRPASLLEGRHARRRGRGQRLLGRRRFGLDVLQEAETLIRFKLLLQ